MTHCGNPNLTRPLVKKNVPMLLFTAERILEQMATQGARRATVVAICLSHSISCFSLIL